MPGPSSLWPQVSFARYMLYMELHMLYQNLKHETTFQNIFICHSFATGSLVAQHTTPPIKPASSFAIAKHIMNVDICTGITPNHFMSSSDLQVSKHIPTPTDLRLELIEGRQAPFWPLSKGKWTLQCA